MFWKQTWNIANMISQITALKYAADFESASQDASEISAELKEIKRLLMEFFENNPTIDQIGNVKCQRTPKKMSLSQKKVCELVEKEVLKEPMMTGQTLLGNIANSIKSATDSNETQIKLALTNKPKKSKK